MLQLLFADPDLVTRQLVDDVLKYERKDGVDAAPRALPADLFPDGRQAVDLRGELADLDMPVLVIRGDQNRVIPAAHADGLPHRVEVHVLEGQGHSPHKRRPTRSTASSDGSWRSSPSARVRPAVVAAAPARPSTARP